MKNPLKSVYSHGVVVAFLVAATALVSPHLVPAWSDEYSYFLAKRALVETFDWRFPMVAFSARSEIGDFAFWSPIYPLLYALPELVLFGRVAFNLNVFLFLLGLYILARMPVDRGARLLLILCYVTALPLVYHVSHMVETLHLFFATLLIAVTGRARHAVVVFATLTRVTWAFFVTAGSKAGPVRIAALNLALQVVFAALVYGLLLPFTATYPYGGLAQAIRADGNVLANVVGFAAGNFVGNLGDLRFACCDARTFFYTLFNLKIASIIAISLINIRRDRALVVPLLPILTVIAVFLALYDVGDYRDVRVLGAITFLFGAFAIIHQLHGKFVFLGLAVATSLAHSPLDYQYVGAHIRSGVTESNLWRPVRDNECTTTRRDEFLIDARIAINHNDFWLDAPLLDRHGRSVVYDVLSVDGGDAELTPSGLSCREVSAE